MTEHIPFDVEAGKLVINWKLLTFPPFKVLYERDSSKNKAVAINELLYVYNMGHHKSSYALMEDDIKEPRIKKALFGDPNHKLDEKVKEALLLYIEALIKCEDRVLYEVDHNIDALRGFMRKYNELSAEEALLKTELLIKTNKQICELLEYKDKLEKRLEDSTSETRKVRNKVKLTFLEKRLSRNAT